MPVPDGNAVPSWKRAVRDVGLGPVVWAGIASVAESATSLLVPGQRGPATRVYVVVLGALAAWALVRLTGSATKSTPSRFEAVIRPQHRPAADLEELGAVERLVGFSVASAFDLHFRLKPLLREIARGRLLLHRSVDLDARPCEARRILGESLWELIQVSPERPGLGLSGIRLDDLKEAVSQLERI